MATEEPKDPFKAMDWKNMGSSDVQNEPSTGPVIKKRLPRKIRQIPECYFLPRRSIPSAIAFYGAWIAGGIGAGMLLEVWIKKKVKGDPVRRCGILRSPTRLVMRSSGIVNI
ncbi:hypothetical protein RHMOL_Rhmol06G0018400 [Rhododendron molle]|uniref:Uncharacterized protein n=1 Tax=Rhododendron molle TaxID=49168 RepID=A0ACC0N7W7_RHOML|nr:hypothetical protein RHMOL_Rhmol06G0018400 [Rhododendron molle]